MAPAGVLTLITPAQPDGLLAAARSALRQPLPEPPARISSPPAVSSNNVLSARLEPGPWILRGEVVESGAALTVGPEATPEGACGVFDAQVRA